MKKILIILIILSIIIISMPQIYSLFSGQHTFYDIEEKNCLKCHSDVLEELNHAEYHQSLTCEDCHSKDKGNISHANLIKPRCLDCHLTFKNDSHDPLIESAISSKLNKAENEACISCHNKKSIDITFKFSDAYIYNAKRDIINGGWQISGSKDNIGSGIVYNVRSNGTKGKGEHSFSKDLKCDKCHLDIRNQLDISAYHSGLMCKDCHLTNATKSHASNMPLCKDCHIITEKEKDSHKLIIENMENSMCSSCHSGFNNKLEFTRPEFIEWDIANRADINNISKWIIENVSFGPNKNVLVNKLGDGKLHKMTEKGNINCVSCHQDVRDAVIKGGHSNEQWKNKHNYGDDMNLYCKSCHLNSLNHGGSSISCLDCHNINKVEMGYIGESMGQQKLFLQSYLCISCKNTGNPTPAINESLHFKFYTEPDIIIYINGAKRYP